MNCAAVYLALVSFIPVWLSEGGSFSCPSDHRGSAEETHIGFRRSKSAPSECVTFHVLVPREHYDPSFRVNHQFSKLCASLYKNGYIHWLASHYDLYPQPTFPSMLCYSGITINSARRLSDVYYRFPGYYFKRWEYEWEHQHRTEVRKYRGTRGSVWDDGDVYGNHVDQWWELFKSSSFHSSFNEGEFPKCSMVHVDSVGLSAHSVIPCSSLVSWETLIIACGHDGYKDCVEEKVVACTYVNKSGRSGWFSFHYKITVPPDEPYGQTCKKQTVFGEPCQPTCKGPWSEWSTNSGKCVDGGVFISRRYQAMTKSDDASRCNEKSVDCCHMEKQVTVDNCFDYDATKKVKLDSTSCKNGGKLVKDAAGYNMCQCKSQYKGITCEEDACKDFCKNSGTCIARVAETICICLPGFTGTTCETPLKLCGQEKKQCANGGNCTWSSDGQSSYCKCPVQFGGDFCDIKTEYCTEKTCSNAGVCHNVTESHSFRCKCNMGRTGKRCETSSEGIGFVFGQFTEGKSAGYIYLIVGIILTLLFLTCGTGTVVHHRRRRRRRGHRRDDMSSVSSAFSSRFTSTLGRFSTMGTSKATSRKTAMSTKGKVSKR